MEPLGVWTRRPLVKDEFQESPIPPSNDKNGKHGRRYQCFRENDIIKRQTNLVIQAKGSPSQRAPSLSAFEPNKHSWCKTVLRAIHHFQNVHSAKSSLSKTSMWRTTPPNERDFRSRLAGHFKREVGVSGPRCTLWAMRIYLPYQSKCVKLQARWQQICFFQPPPPRKEKKQKQEHTNYGPGPPRCQEVAK